MHTHLFFELLAYTLGFQLYLYLSKKTENQNLKKLDTDRAILLLIGGMLGAALGSKLLGILEHPEIWSKIFSHWEYLYSTKTIVGGLLGGLIGVELSKKYLRIAFSTGDSVCYPLILGICIGRIGCFLNCLEDSTFGNPTEFMFGIDSGDGIKRHPVSLYEIFFLSWVGFIIFLISKSVSLVPGAKFKIFMLLYLSWRFFIEFFKPISKIPYIGLSAIQLACIFGLIYYQILYLNQKKFLLERDGW